GRGAGERPAGRRDEDHDNERSQRAHHQDLTLAGGLRPLVPFAYNPTATVEIRGHGWTKSRVTGRPFRATHTNMRTKSSGSGARMSFRRTTRSSAFSTHSPASSSCSSASP